MGFCNNGEIVGTKDLQITRFTENVQKTFYGKTWANWHHSFDLLSCVPSGLTGPPSGVAVRTGDHDIFSFVHLTAAREAVFQIALKYCPQEQRGNIEIKS